VSDTRKRRGEGKNTEHCLGGITPLSFSVGGRRKNGRGSKKKGEGDYHFASFFQKIRRAGGRWRLLGENITKNGLESKEGFD